jgi:hypothetical protein
MKTVLITGATGNIGRKLRAHLDATGKYALRLLCRNPGNGLAVHTADLSTYDQDWAAEFDGVDTVLHVAADPSPRAGWGRIQSRNIDLLLNVLATAEQHRVRRVVFASSNFVVTGHRFGREALTPTMEPAPINPYGASKLFGERVGKMFAERYGVSFIGFHIGVCQRANNNAHGPRIPFGQWGQAMMGRGCVCPWCRPPRPGWPGCGTWDCVTSVERLAGPRWWSTLLLGRTGHAAMPRSICEGSRRLPDDARRRFMARRPASVQRAPGGRRNARR